MSWTGFKKAVNRAGAHVIMKTNKNKETSVDPEFDQREKDFETFEKFTTELNSELMNFKAIFVDLIDTQLKLSKALDSFYGDYNFDIGADNMVGIDIESADGSTSRVNERDGISLEMLKNMKSVKSSLLDELSEPLDVTVFSPIRELTEYNDEIHKLIKKRGRKKFDFDVAKTKLEKLQNDYNMLELSLREDNHSTTNSAVNSNNQLDKLKEKLNKMTLEYENYSSIYSDINQRLKNEIDEYISLRFQLLDPSFESFIKIQLKLYTDLAENLKDKITIDSSSKEEHETGLLDQRLDEIVNKMKSLEINNL